MVVEGEPTFRRTATGNARAFPPRKHHPRTRFGNQRDGTSHIARITAPATAVDADEFRGPHYTVAGARKIHLQGSLGPAGIRILRIGAQVHFVKVAETIAISIHRIVDGIPGSFGCGIGLDVHIAGCRCQRETVRSAIGNGKCARAGRYIFNRGTHRSICMDVHGNVTPKPRDVQAGTKAGNRLCNRGRNQG